MGSDAFLRRLQRHVRTRLVSGLLVLVPLWITVVVLKAVFAAMASFLTPVVRMAGGDLSDRAVLAISLAIFVALVYLVGLITAHVAGRRLVAFAEQTLLRVPVVRAIYGATKQVVDALSLSNRGAFKSVVLVEFPRPGMWALAFATGTVRCSDGEVLCKVFIPTSPNPTTGFFELLPCRSVRWTLLTVEQGLKMILSGGVVSPDEIRIREVPADDTAMAAELGPGRD